MPPDIKCSQSGAGYRCDAGGARAQSRRAGPYFSLPGMLTFGTVVVKLNSQKSIDERDASLLNKGDF